MNIVYLTFYFEPDLCAGSFRNTALVRELAEQLTVSDTIQVVTTQPNRYQSFRVLAPEQETWQATNGCWVKLNRVRVPTHASGLTDQIRSFRVYEQAVYRLTRDRKYDLVVASSSRLFTAFLGARLARRCQTSLFLDIRDLFRESILDILPNPLLRLFLNPVLRSIERYTFGYARHINLVSEGFRSYFNSFGQATYSYFTNGIDGTFLTCDATVVRSANLPKTLLYAGNIGEGQGLHTIIPEAARQLGADYRFVIIGDGGARPKLEAALRAQAIENVELRLPVTRNELRTAYAQADYLFVHLNNLAAFRRVLPSKLFEYGATDKPIVAGVAGYAAQFVSQYLDNYLLFDPGDADSLVRQLRSAPYRTAFRPAFVRRFSRKTIAEAMAEQIVGTVHPPKPVTL